MAKKTTTNKGNTASSVKKNTEQKTQVKKETSNNEVKKEAVNSVKNAIPAKKNTAKRLESEALIDAVINHIAGIISEIRKKDDRKFYNVNDIIEKVITELEDDGRINELRKNNLKTHLDKTLIYLEDQRSAIELLRSKL